MNSVNAYFIGGPKHGDVDIVDGIARDVLIAVSNETARAHHRQVVDEGHYSYTAYSDLSYKTGRYRREHELYGMPGMNTARKNVLFIWAGVG